MEWTVGLMSPKRLENPVVNVNTRVSGYTVIGLELAV